MILSVDELTSMSSTPNITRKDSAHPGGGSPLALFDRSHQVALEEILRLAAVLSGADFAYIAWPDGRAVAGRDCRGILRRDSHGGAGRLRLGHDQDCGCGGRHGRRPV
uniref:Uncharacterized protein n=1 Tax=mine drainage metagenome TaxID=410659 RepID=E6QIX9_9ZZZZ